MNAPVLFERALRFHDIGGVRPPHQEILGIEPVRGVRLPHERVYRRCDADASSTSARGKAIQCGAASCPRTIDILPRFAGPPMNPKHTGQDVTDIIAELRKVYPQVMA